MTPQELVDRLAALVPDFRPSWDDAGNCYRNDDGSFTLHGVFAEFTNFFRERHASLPPNKIAALGAFVSARMASADTNLDNAAATCFVENVAGEPCSAALGLHLTGAAHAYWRAWGDASSVSSKRRP